MHGWLEKPGYEATMNSNCALLRRFRAFIQLVVFGLAPSMLEITFVAICASFRAPAVGCPPGLMKMANCVAF